MSKLFYANHIPQNHSLKSPCSTKSPSIFLCILESFEAELSHSHKSFNTNDREESRTQDVRNLTTFSTHPRFGIFGAFGTRRGPMWLHTGSEMQTNRKDLHIFLITLDIWLFYGVLI